MQAATTLTKAIDKTANANHGLTYPIADAPAPGAVTQIAEGVLWLRMPLPFVLNHINLWLIEDGEGWTIVDCGFATDQARECWNQILARELKGKPVTRVIVTHFHPDHIGLCDWLCQKHGLLPWMSKAEFLQSHIVCSRGGAADPELLRGLMTAHGLDGPRMKWIAERENLYPRGVPSLPHGHQRMRENDVIKIGAHTWRVIVGHGHSPEHVSLYCAALGLFISGDMLLPRISTNVSVWPAEPEADPVGEFLDSLKRYAQLPGDTLVLPSHGLPFRGLNARVDALHEHHRSRLERVMQACVKPQAAVDVIPVLFDRKFDDHHLLFAMGEGIAHLNYLMHRGQLRRTCDGGYYQFQRMELAA
ncbi:MAG: MBL fold metallo-hydrolase [Betaproteobacteria bacterium]|nr:MBL fold metallo-hydrolase [Betaproteobacteria bacterium]